MQPVSSQRNNPHFTEEQMKADVEALLANANYADNLSPTANLIELGLDSMTIMRLVDQWRRQGLKTTFADLIETPTLQHWYSLLQTPASATEQTKNISELLARSADKDYYNEKPFPLTDVQYAYWIGRQDEQQLGSVGCHAYIELDGTGVQPERLEQAWQQLLQQHSMLRVSFTEDGQQLINAAPAKVQLAVNDFSAMTLAQADDALLDIRSRLSHRKLDVDNGQVFGLELSLLANNKTRIHFDVDLLVADVQSLHILLRDLAAAYNQKAVSKDIADWRFAQYLAVEAERNQAQIETDKNYWQERLSTLPSGPQLPLLKDPQEITKSVFTRRAHLLQEQSWQQIKTIAASYQITPAMVLATAYAEVLAQWSAEQSFVLNLPLFDRKTDHPGIENVVADFTNLLLLECNCQQAASFADRAQFIQRQFHTDVAHASYSAVSIQRDLAKQGLAQGVSAPVVFACNLGTPLLTDECRQTLGDFSYMISQTPQVWLDHQLYEVEDGLLLAWDSVDELFPADLIETMFTSYVNLLEQLAKGQTYWQQPGLILLPEQQYLQRQAVNSTDSDYSEHLLHHGMFATAATEPERIALIDGDIQFTYQQLANASLQVASLLQASGLKAGDPVAVTLPRGIAQVCAVFGILAAGGCYVPVGVHQPASRQAKIHRTAGIKLVLTDAEHLTQETIDGVTRLDITNAAQHQPISAPVEVPASQAAYIIFTSGSTGEPKGVEMAHAATANTIDHLNQRYGVNQNSRGLAVSALDFDLSVYDLFGLLSVGGSVVLLQDCQRRDANIWLNLIHQHQVNLWNSVPVLLDMLLVVAEADKRTLPFKQVMLSGDWIGLDLPPRLAAKTSADNQLIAMGGATEAAIWSNAYDVTTPLPAHWTSIPYGKPLANQSYRVVDSQGRDCPDWVPGELWIGGIGLANGYKCDAELTQQRFVTVNGQRWYRTGDRGRYWPDGNLEFLGRLDHQVKVRGHRIELGEIETALTTISGIARAAVVAVGQPKSLAAALVAAEIEPLDTEKVRQALHELVPDYMVPTTLAVIDSIPLSANGKVDRKQISQQLIGLVSEQSIELTAPETLQEQAVAKLWQNLLAVETVGRESNFFALGGDSLLATQVITQLRQQGLTTSQPLRLLFAKPVLSQFAAELTQGKASEVTQVLPQPEQRYQPFPLTEVQRAYWMGQSPGLPLSCGTHYLVELDGENVDLTRIESAWNLLVKRHEMMRAIVDQDGQQRILEQVPEVTLEINQLSKDSNAQAAQDYLHQCWHRQSKNKDENIASDSWPLHQLHAVIYGENSCRLGIIFDYLTLDGFSIKLLLQELAELYQTLAENTEQALIQTKPELELSFRDYVTQVQPEPAEVEAAETYWRERLTDLPLAPELPLAMDPANLTNVEFQRREARLSEQIWGKLKQKARANQLTPSVLLLVVYSQIIRQWSGGNDFTLNLTLFDRRNVHQEINQVLGDFTSLAPVAFHQANGNSLLQQAKATQQEIADVLEHRPVSSIWIQRERSRRMSLTSAALPVVFTSTLGLGGGLFEQPSDGFPELVAGGLSETPQVWLDHQLYEYKNQLAISWDAAEALFPKGMLDQMFSAYVNLLEQLADSDWTADLALALPEKQQLQRQAVNNTDSAYTEHLLHQGMFATAATEPERIAIIDGEAQLSYQQLANASLQVASLLQASGFKVGDPVAVTLPRGIAQVCAVFGILAAGGCYVPVGVHQPASRQAKIHRTAGIKLVLTDADNIAQESIDGVTRLDVTSAAQHQPLAEPVAVSPSQAAYIIFTSGSTGEPKGVEMAHAATANTIDHLNQRYGVNQNSRGLAVSALDFDLSVYDLFGLLSVGGAVVLLQDSQRRDANTWLNLIHQHQVNLWNSVPVLLDMLLVVAEADNRSLPFKQVMLSGDWIGLDLPARLAAKTHADNQLIAMGGATEAAIWSNAYDVTTPLPAHWTSIPYGKPLANQSYRVVDSQGRDCPDWVPGELWIGGIGLANGYKGDTELTQQRFVTVNGQRWYRTGDRGRYWPDGNLEFLGRLDHQVKVRGHRIELGEIETALTTIPGIARTAVVAVGQPKSLAAALVAAPDTEVLDTEKIRQALHELVPDYMVPTTLAVIDTIPLSANGKVDRKQITQQLQALAINEQHYEPPANNLEQQIAEIWAEVLNCERISRRDDFFQIGGDSLTATQIIQLLQKRRVSPADISLVTLFSAPNIAALAAEIETSWQALGINNAGEESTFEEGTI